MYQSRGLLKFAEEDNWDEGCDPSTTQSYPIDANFSGKTPDEVIKKIADYLGVDNDAIEKNACDEDGRVDFAKTEDADGSGLTKRQTEQWKRGQIKAWYCIYTAIIEKVERVKV